MKSGIYKEFEALVCCVIALPEGASKALHARDMFELSPANNQSFLWSMSPSSNPKDKCARGERFNREEVATVTLCIPSFSASQLVLALWCSRIVVRSSTPAGVVISLAKCGKTLLLCDGIDIGTDEKGNDVEKGDPGVLGKELLCEGEREWGSDPADLHDGHETCLPGCMDLMDRLRAGDNGHRDQVHTVLDGGNLGSRVSTDHGPRQRCERTIKLLTRI